MAGLGCRYWPKHAPKLERAEALIDRVHVLCHALHGRRIVLGRGASSSSSAASARPRVEAVDRVHLPFQRGALLTERLHPIEIFPERRVFERLGPPWLEPGAGFLS